MDFNDKLTLNDALRMSDHDYVWCATLLDGRNIFEQPGLSSDALPYDRVTDMAYLPRLRDMPRLSCHASLIDGERIVRYWTTIWQPIRGDRQFLYVLGLRRDDRYALIAWYPQSRRYVFADHRPFNAPWNPADPYVLLPDNVLRLDGPSPGWRHNGYGGELSGAVMNMMFRST
jgi:hypothetical protein